MKKLIYILLLCLIPFTLSGCEIVPDSNRNGDGEIKESDIVFHGINDAKVSIAKEGEYNVLSGVGVLLKDEYITSYLKYYIYDVLNEESVEKISRTFYGKYEVVYTLDYPGLKKPIEKIRNIQVGDVCIGCIVYDESKVQYEMVWSDEFDYEGKADPTKWTYETGGHGWGNNELQYYTNREKNAFVKDGKLTINLLREDYNGKKYTSSRLITNGKFDFTYGKVEVFAKLPMGLGTWPAIWMLGSDFRSNSWPKCGEIDIMEHVGYDQNRIHSTIHTNRFNGGKGTQKGQGRVIKNVATEFHKYGLEWLPDKLIFTVDDSITFIYDARDYNNGNPTVDEWPFKSDFFLILNIAFGGDWGGARGIDQNFTSATMEIDYVRVYQSTYITNLMKG